MGFERTEERILKILKYPICKLAYADYGFKSLIFRPIRIVGRKYISLGKSVNVYRGARIECIDRWGDDNFHPVLQIGDRTSFEQGAHITTAGNLVIGHDCVFLPRVMITTIDHDYSIPGKNVLRQKIIVQDTYIGNYCLIGMDAKIFPGVHIGDNVIIGANSIVTHDVPSFSVVVGSPARIIKRFDDTSREWVSVL